MCTTEKNLEVQWWNLIGKIESQGKFFEYFSFGFNIDPVYRFLYKYRITSRIILSHYAMFKSKIVSQILWIFKTLVPNLQFCWMQQCWRFLQEQSKKLNSEDWISTVNCVNGCTSVLISLLGNSPCKCSSKPLTGLQFANTTDLARVKRLSTLVCIEICTCSTHDVWCVGKILNFCELDVACK